MSLIKGGTVGFNSVTYFSENFKSVALRKRDGTIHVEISKRKQLRKIDNLINQIPLIRGLFLFVKPLIDKWKLYVIILLPLYILLLVGTRTAQTDSGGLFFSSLQFVYYMINNHFFLTLSISLLFATMIIKMSDLGKYHAAEHMTDLSFEYNGSIELIDVAKHSRVHSKCGTNIVVFVFLFNLLFSFFDMNIYISIALSFSLAYEVFQIPSKYLKPFLGIGAIIQFVLFTSKPSSVHLKVAKASYEALIREEENYRNVKQNNPTD